MDNYYNKYIKYKNKYLELKKHSENKNETNEELNYKSILKKKYPDCVFDKTTLKNADEYLKNGYATTYGEMDYEAIEKFNSFYNKLGKFKTFIDFGSGRGKLPIFMALYVDKSIGIELVTERHNDAIKLKQEMSLSFPNIAKKVELLNIDMFKFLETINTFDSPVMVWISNLCFGDIITTKLFNVLVKKLPPQSIIGSSKLPSELPNGIKLINKLQVKMSWSENSDIYISEIN